MYHTWILWVMFECSQWERAGSFRFMMSMLAAGIGEFLANPPVVIKNYQLAPECTNKPTGRWHHRKGNYETCGNSVTSRAKTKKNTFAIRFEFLAISVFSYFSSICCWIFACEHTQASSFGEATKSKTQSFNRVVIPAFFVR